jgi:ectoine hydroxylase-related dioxygenase (phytanoyl-CoA dioxygenase family)
LEKNRTSPKIRAAYEQLWGRTDLWMNTDRVSFNPPETEFWSFPGPRLHWDVSLELPIPFGLQGLLYLSDTEATQGAFTLVPGFHKKITEWINSLPPGADPRTQDLSKLGPQPVAANAGDFIIWHQALPHGSSANTATRPRIVQYINYLPVDAETKDKWK